MRRTKIIGHPVDFGDGTEVIFWYDRNKMTDVWLEEWQEHEKKTNVPALNEMLADLIDRWDLVEEEGGPEIPVSAVEIGRLFSLPVKLFLMQQLLTAGVPSRAEGEALGAPWSDSPPEQSTASMPPQPEKPQTLPNGDAPSPLPAPSASPSPT